jgi:hypothetical protein
MSALFTGASNLVVNVIFNSSLVLTIVQYVQVWP